MQKSCKALLTLLSMWCISVKAQEHRFVNTMPPAPLHVIRDSSLLSEYLKAAAALEPISIDSAMLQYYRILLSCIVSHYAEGVDSALIYMHRRSENSMSNYTADLANQALFYTKNFAHPNIVARISNDLGAFSFHKSRYKQSAVYFNFALQKLVDTNLSTRKLKLSIYNNLGSLWGVLHEDGNSLYYLRKAELLASDLKDYKQLAMILGNIGVNYLNRESWDTASLYCRQSLVLAEKFHAPLTYSMAILNLANIALKNNNPDEALGYLAKGRQRNKATTPLIKTTPANEGVKPATLLYDDYEGWAYYLKKDYRNAKARLLYAFNNQKRYGLRSDAMETAEMLHKVFAESGDYSHAYEYLQYYLSVRDSLRDYEKGKAIDVEIKYRTAEKDKAIAQKQLRLANTESQLKQKNTLFVAVTVGSLLFITFMLSIYKGYRHKQKLQTERIRVLQHEQEIGKLKAMIEGEERERTRLGGALHAGIMVELSAIKMKLRMLEKLDGPHKDHVTDLISQIDHTTRELRKTAHNLMPDMLLEGGLEEAIFYFCKKVENENLQVNFHQFGNIPRLPQDFEVSLYRMVQELVQNIIKHANATHALIQLSYRDDLLCITVEDNGTGFNAQSQHFEGMGLKNLKARVRALKGIIEINSTEQSGTAINIEFDTRLLNENKTPTNAY